MRQHLAMLVGPGLLVASLIGQALAQTTGTPSAAMSTGPSLDYLLTLGPYGALVWGAYLLGRGVKLTIQVELSGRVRELLSKAGGDKFEYVGPALTDRQWFGDGMGIAVRKGDQDLKAKLDEAIKTLRANGKYQEINQKYFKYDIYGG